MILKEYFMYKRSQYDRRTEDRRQVYNLDVFNKIGRERRRKERRVSPELREGWVRVSEWSSVLVNYQKYI